MRPIIGATALALLVASQGFAQTIQIPERIDRLGEKAREVVNITLDGQLLQLASQFLSSTDRDQAKIKNIVSRLRAIHVRSFEFDRDAQYSDADVAPVREQLRAPGWSRIIDTRSDGEHVEVYTKQDKGQLDGLVIISAERRELAIVSIDGAINLSDLSSLGGQFGIPGGVIPNTVGKPAPAPEPRPAPQGGGGKKDGDE